MSSILQSRSLTQRFDGFTALDGVDFTLRAGEIHALLGENGAGKSTLMNVLGGVLPPTSGEIVLDDKPVRWSGPQDAASRGGIGMVHQHFQLVPVFTVIENLTLSTQQTGFMLRRREIERQAEELAGKLGWRIPMHVRAGDLPVGAQQRVEILTALLLKPRILFFDEPTSVLTPGEADELFGVLRALRDGGASIVFVSHKLSEVMALCDRVTVLHRGRVVGDVAIADTGEADLARRMVGSEVETVARATGIAAPKAVGSPEPLLEIVALRADRVGRDDVVLKNITFSVAPGEVLGIAGVDGNGQTELFECLCGLRPFRLDPQVREDAERPGILLRASYPYRLNGRALRKVTPDYLLTQGVAWIPPDRQREGLALSLSVERNLLLTAAREKGLRFGPFLKRRAMRRQAAEWMQTFDIRAPPLKISASSLSGGNQQKIVVARALARNPKLLIAASPTRGLDVGAAAYVQRKLRESQERGAGVLLISTELDEIRLLASRIAVIYEGRIVGIVPGDTPREQIGLMMGGQMPAGADAS